MVHVLWMWSNGQKCRVIALQQSRSRGILELLDMRYGIWIQSLREFKGACEIVFFDKVAYSSPECYLIWTAVQCLEHVTVFKRQV